MPTPETPPNINEFNQIAALIFAPLYQAFPVVVDINENAIVRALGVSEENWGNHVLPSGRAFNVVLSNTIGWLKADGYTVTVGALASKGVVLTTKGLQVMNVVLYQRNETVGAELRKATEAGGFDLSKLGDLIGGAIGGFWKSLGSG